MGQEAIRMLKMQLMKSELSWALLLPAQGWRGWRNWRVVAEKCSGLWEEKTEQMFLGKRKSIRR